MEVTLKAKWKDSIGLMQDFDCSTLGLNETKKLRDKRDDNKYIVVQMVNMKCWMTQNLQIENKVLTPEDSNVVTNYTLPASSKNGFSAYDTSNVYIDPTYGGYYNWYTATAGAGLKDVTAPTYGSSDYNVASSICPRGWRLPTSGNDDSDFGRLPLYLAGLNPSSMVDAITSPPLKFTLSGQLYQSQLINQGNQGHYWSSTPAGFIKSKAYYLYFGGSTIDPKNIINDKNYGKSVRCIAEDRTIHNIKYMQEMAPKVCENTTTPYKTSTALDTDGSHHRDKNFVPTKTLIDRRDNNTYTVSKLADGKCWMTQNLRVAGRTITPADSDITSNYNIPASSLSGFDNYDTSNAYVDNTYGGYYTWYTATAGTGTQSLSTNGYNTTVSICPKGWRLPTSGSSNSDFNILYNNYNSSSALRSSPVNLTLSGYVNNSSMYSKGWNGWYWSSTVYGNGVAYDLSLYSSGVDPSNSSHELNGLPVRCVAR